MSSPPLRIPSCGLRGSVAPGRALPIYGNLLRELHTLRAVRHTNLLVIDGGLIAKNFNLQGCRTPPWRVVQLNLHVGSARLQVGGNIHQPSGIAGLVTFPADHARLDARGTP